MRILFLADVSIEHVIGGAERVLYEQTVRLARKGHQVFILTRFLPEHTEKYKFIDGVHEWRYTVDYQNIFTFLFSTRVNAPVILSNLLKDGVFNLVNGHQPFTSWAFLCTHFARKIPFVYTCHSLAFEEFLTRHARPTHFLKRCLQQMQAFYLKRMEKGVLRASAAIVALSEFTRQKLLSIHGMPNDRIHIIPGGVDTSRFTPPPDRLKMKMALGLPLDKPVLITVRNLVPRMGLENLINALPEIKKAITEFIVIIGGEGPLKETLKSMVEKLNLENFVSFPGFLPEEKLPLYLGAADYFVLPTVALEGFGLVTVESLACGTPVLGTPIGGTLEILKPLDEGLLFPDISPPSMATSIIERLRAWKENKESYLSLREKCRKYVEERYAWEVNVEKTEQLFYRMAR
ncbi:MAG TPA: glycosyltransferase family 4 protein [Syntrophales bacterium]|nr:glycosyltransferase family 4 protein [Syntrophales bacterium]HOL59246.1 glycosyltransferase family 4 protein [Syntrophales bacterium]HPO35296.1 glycosyltransferase family 4 protein [Syntrophales bacterium]